MTRRHAVWLALAVSLGMHAWADAPLGRTASAGPGITAAQRQGYARDLIQSGDRAYKRHRYSKAERDYGNSAANQPSAHAYILYGDSHWRAVVQYNEKRPPNNAAGCQWGMRQLAGTMPRDVAQTYDRGFALARQTGDQAVLSAPWFTRAEEIARCLHALAPRLRAYPEGACIDPEPIRQCLGAPLLT